MKNDSDDAENQLPPLARCPVASNGVQVAVVVAFTLGSSRASQQFSKLNNIYVIL